MQHRVPFPVGTCPVSPLKSARLRRKESLMTTSAAVAIDMSTLSRVENGKQGASPELAERLAHHFGISELQILYPARYPG